MSTPTRRVWLPQLLLAGAFVSNVSHGQVIVAPQAGNQLGVTATATVSPSGGLYTYSYAFTNAAASAQAAWFIVVELNGDAASGITNIKAPKGWQALPLGSTPGVIWAATEIDTIPANYMDDGGVLPSPYQIQPGQTLSGFSFQSPAPPSAVKFYAQGFSPLPVAVDADDLIATGYSAPDYTKDSIIGLTQGPAPTSKTLQPSAAGFFSFIGLINNAVVKVPLSVGVQFNTTLVAVNTSSLHVTLNGSDITAAFVRSGQSLSATLGQGTLPLNTGVNVLEGVVSGIPNGETQTKYDSNLVRFYFNSARSLDLNGDGVINCADLAIVKASFGKSTGQAGFDPRADVNGDGVVNVIDLSTVARALPAGIVCN